MKTRSNPSLERRNVGYTLVQRIARQLLHVLPHGNFSQNKKSWNPNVFERPWPYAKSEISVQELTIKNLTHSSTLLERQSVRAWVYRDRELLLEYCMKYIYIYRRNVSCPVWLLSQYLDSKWQRLVWCPHNILFESRLTKALLETCSWSRYASVFSVNETCRILYRCSSTILQHCFAGPLIALHIVIKARLYLL